MTSANLCGKYSFSTNSFLSLAHRCEMNAVVTTTDTHTGWKPRGKRPRSQGSNVLFVVSLYLVCPSLSKDGHQVNWT